MFALLFIQLLLQDVFAKDSIKDLAYSKYWLNLGHYRSRLFGGYKSEVDGEGFFLSPEGKYNPFEELEATIKVFENDKPIYGRKKDQFAQCIFVERFRFLVQKLPLDVKRRKCSDFDEWITALNPRSATLVYAAAYPKNSASAFGHTFLRINTARKDSKKKMDLLDYGVGFAAVLPPDYGFEYALFGLIGVYSGRFSLNPYYMKVNEYAHLESRDLWEYDLDLNGEQTIRLLSHLWELEQSTHFNYFFLDENCAYHLLSLLEIARPDWDLTDQFDVYTLPAETVKAVARKEGVVKNVEFRPSLLTKLKQHEKILTSEEKKIYDTALRGDVSKIENSLVLDTAILRLNILKNKNKGKLDPEQKKILRKLLIRRSKVSPTRDIKESYSKISDPLKSHHPVTVGLAGAWSDMGETQYLTYRPGVHDLFDPSFGYGKYAELEVLKSVWGFRNRYKGRGSRFYLDQLTLLDVKTIFPSTFKDPFISWKISLLYSTPKDFDCDLCHSLRLAPGGGIAVNLFSEDVLFYTMVSPVIEFSKEFSGYLRWGPEVKMAFFLTPFQFLRSELSFLFKGDYDQTQRDHESYRLQWINSFNFGQSWAFRLTWNRWLRDSLRESNRWKMIGELRFNFY